MKQALFTGLFVYMGIVAGTFAQCGLGKIANTAGEAAMVVKGLSHETVANLQAAYHGESNATERYRLFATQAEKEGYKTAARAFNAAATAEEIHAKEFARILTCAGVTPKMEIEKVTIASTLENLKGALDGETKEADEIYPRFMSVATSKGDVEVATLFRRTIMAEATHTRIFSFGVLSLENWGKGDLTFHVCPLCGYTIDSKNNLTRCPACKEDRAKFIAFR